MATKVLMVAEKPSISLSIATALSGGRMSTRRGSTDVHEFDGQFRGYHVRYKVTSVIGHVFSLDFPSSYQNWEVTDPMDLFHAPVLKSESNPKAHIRRHLYHEAQGCTYLVLWLDCDREGENICYEVIECTGIHETGPGRIIYRARFSSVTEKDIFNAMENLVGPNKDEALAVDARQEIDLKVAVMFQKLVANDGTLKVTDISTKEESKSRPCGLNTVNMLKVASSALGFGPQMAMQLAERLYTQGFISYPRTESTAYPSSFDFRSALSAHLRNPIWGNDVQILLADGFCKPRMGSDAGDHPPITPMRSATEDMLGSDAWRLYQYICQHFIGSVSPDCKYTRTKIEFTSGGELFYCVGQHVISKGFTSIMPWMGVSEKNLPQFKNGDKINILKVDLHEGTTSPPDYLSESELISLMEKNGIGTDASIPVHINNICERNYVQVNSGRRLVPTALGTTLIRGYQRIDPDLCLPDIRSFIEQQITLIAKGKADHVRVVEHVLQQFMEKYSYFVKKIEDMDALFEAQFSPLADSGRLLSKCGKCTRYMKYISSQPTRLYCITCEEVYHLPQNGTIKLYKELACPLDGFELLIFSMAGPDGKTFPLCPYCYNSPPFEGIDKLFGTLKLGNSGKIGKGAGMPCFLCPHPTCPHSLITQGVCACPECSGTLVLDPVSAPKWRLCCNMCNCLVSLPQGAHRISTTGKRCPECDSTIIEVDFNKKTTVLSDGATLHEGCILCDELLHSLVEVKHGSSFFRRGRGRGRNRGRGRHRGRGRGGSKHEDPKMSFRDF
ncbi:DNA topoisomerase 3-beta-like isoform X2 [Musa acuminata AAA Group]|uniref:DNA topoisomerase 3-beta-like isoform X2 n=1 Tax=Musa acuminata AAA Group TaxID=214697 RepID=UPI0031DF5ED3